MRAYPDAHGGELVDLMLDTQAAARLKAESRDFPSWDLTPRQTCDLELLLTGACSPLRGFMGRRDYERVLRDMRLADGTLWPMPVALDVTREFADPLAAGARIALRDAEGLLLAVMRVSDIFSPDLAQEAQAVYGSTDTAHPGVDALLNHGGPVYLGGSVEGVALPAHYDFRHLRRTPREVRESFARQGWRRIVAFHTRGPMHRAQVEMTAAATRAIQGNLLLHPAATLRHAGDLDHYTRVRCYEHVMPRYPEGSAQLALLPLATRHGGPREALWQAIIRKNFGCTHFIVGPDHAGAGADFNAPGAAHELAARHAEELGIGILPCARMQYVEDRAQYRPAADVMPGERVLSLSEAEFQRRLAEGLEIPEWFSFPEVVRELRRAHPPKARQGVTVFFTGLSGAGKSTIANALLSRLTELGARPVTLLDGDIVRKNLSSELGFSRAHRDLNILRIGFVASEITKHGGIAICAPIAPYAATRARVREMVAAVGGFIEVHVATPIEVCEQRDRKGLYAKARAGLIKEFTGVSDPYEAPARAELVINTQECTPIEAAQIVLNRLEADGYVR